MTDVVIEHNRTIEIGVARYYYFLAPVRVVVRLTCLTFWVFLCWCALILASTAAFVAPSWAAATRRGISHVWVRCTVRLLGMRIVVKGAVPAPPYLLVINHVTWGDYFLVNRVCDAVCLLQSADENYPFVGRLMKGLDPIFVDRVPEDVPRVKRSMIKAMEEGKNLLMAPEATVSPGKVVRRFHAAFLDPAAQMGRPVHYASVTCRTPHGCPPASKAVLFGPDPFYRTANGRIPDSELEAWGPERSFLMHFLRLLALPWHEFTMTFGPDPIADTNRIALANRLHDAVQAIFTPVL